MQQPKSQCTFRDTCAEERSRIGRYAEPTVEVQWMDYTCKYGVGYFLSDGSCGVYFNDSTKIVQPPSGQK